MVLENNSNKTMIAQQVQRSKIYLLVAPILVLLWIPFDYYLETVYFRQFLALRIMFAAVALSLWFLITYHEKASRYHVIINLVVYLCLIISIFPMVFMAREFYPYLLGFTTTFTGTAIVVIWPASYTAIPCLAALILGPVIGFGAPEPDIKLVTYYYVLGTILAISTTSSWFTYRSAVVYDKLTSELEQLSIVDTLTNIANRRQFDQRLQEEWERAVRNKNPLSLVVCDVDHFKSYNDYYGHLQGDQCLKMVAAAISSVVTRPADLTARYGGEEFGIILPNTDCKGATHIANQINKRVVELGILHGKSAIASTVTVSVGVASMIPDEKSSAHSLFKQADQALYKAKKEGRNRVSVACHS